jgi:hypothetical protein
MRGVAPFCLGALVLAWSPLSVAGEVESFVVTTRDLAFPMIDTSITFTRTSDHVYRARYSSPPPSADHLMLYTGLYLCAARSLALDAGFDRFALLPDEDVARGDAAAAGVTAFLKPGEEASKVLEPRFATARFSSIDLVAKNCPPQANAKH